MRNIRRWTLWFTDEGERDENRPAMVSGPPLTLRETDGRGVELVPADDLQGVIGRVEALRRPVSTEHDPDRMSTAHTRGYNQAIADVLVTLGGQ